MPFSCILLHHSPSSLAETCVLLFNWELLRPRSTPPSPEHGVTHTPSNRAQDTNLSATQKGISTLDLQGDMRLHPQAAGQEEALHRVPSRDGTVRSYGGTGHFGQDCKPCFSSMFFSLVWQTARREPSAACHHKPSTVWNAMLLLLSLINESDQTTIQHIDF